MAEKFIEVTVRLPVVEAYGTGDDPSVPAMSCRRCRRDFDDHERIAKVDRFWLCLPCVNQQHPAVPAFVGWCDIADHIAERPSRQSAATIRATLQNLAAMARNQWWR